MRDLVDLVQLEIECSKRPRNTLVPSTVREAGEGGGDNNSP
jgi:hypothetical protein